MSKTPSRVTIKTALTQARVDGYWRELNMSQDTWMKNFSAAQRYETVISDLLDKLSRAEETLKDGK